jgi:hypothetical protein
MEETDLTQRRGVAVIAAIIASRTPEDRVRTSWHMRMNLAGQGVHTMRVEIDQSTRPRNRRVVRSRLVQTNAEKIAQWSESAARNAMPRSESMLSNIRPNCHAPCVVRSCCGSDFSRRDETEAL